jgi:hypothetical protein
LQINYTEDLLNNSQLFDFDYEPKAGDQLALHLNRYDYWLTFAENKWTFESSTVFDHPKHLFKEYLKGKIKKKA